MTQVLYAAGLLLLMAAFSLELWYVPNHDQDAFFSRQMILVFAALLFPFAARPVAPRGPLCPFLAIGIGVIGSIFLLLAHPQFHKQPFPLFLNTGFLRALVLVAALFAAAWLVRRGGQKLPEDLPAPAVLGLFGILMLWLVMTQEIWVHYRLSHGADWRLPAYMYISVSWAVYASALMVIGLRWRRRSARYLGLGIFVLLLAKIFLVDTRTLDVTYRIAGFLATGLALVGVSYLYQYLKKKGFFEPVRWNGEAAQDGQRPDGA